MDTINEEKIINETLILRTGTYHQDEVDPAWEKLEWYGLYQGMEEGKLIGSYKKITLKFNSFHDPILDNKGEKSGIEVICLENNPLLLISGLDLYDGKKMNFENINKTSLLPGESFIVNNYEFKAVGDMDEYGIIRNYELLICGKKEGKYIEDSFLQIEYFDDAMCEFFLDSRY